MRRGALTLVLVVMLAACGGNEGGALPLGEPSREDAAAAVTTLLAKWDDRLAFFAVMASFDRGYSVAQVIEHASAVDADGTIAQVAPDGSPPGLLSPLPGGQGAAPPRIAAAPRRLVAGTDDLSPQNQFVDFIDASLGEVYEAARSHLDREGDFQQSVVEMTLLLGSSGYSVEQIVEALILDTWDFTVSDTGGICYVIADGAGIATPARLPLKFADLVCPGVFTATTTTTTTTATDTPVVSGDASFDGSYTGTATWLIAIPSYEFLDTAVTATVTGGVIDLQVEYTLRWDRHLDNGVPTCTTTVHDVLRGSATITADGFTIPMAGVSREVVAAVGSDCDGVEGELQAEWAEDTAVPIPLEAQIADGALTGSFFEAAIGITASRD